MYISILDGLLTVRPHLVLTLGCRTTTLFCCIILPFSILLVNFVLFPSVRCAVFVAGTLGLLGCPTSCGFPLGCGSFAALFLGIVSMLIGPWSGCCSAIPKPSSISRLPFLRACPLSSTPLSQGTSLCIALACGMSIKWRLFLLRIFPLLVFTIYERGSAHLLTTTPFSHNFVLWSCIRHS